MSSSSFTDLFQSLSSAANSSSLIQAATTLNNKIIMYNNDFQQFLSSSPSSPGSNSNNNNTIAFVMKSLTRALHQSSTNNKDLSSLKSVATLTLTIFLQLLVQQNDLSDTENCNTEFEEFTKVLLVDCFDQIATAMTTTDQSCSIISGNVVVALCSIHNTNNNNNIISHQYHHQLLISIINKMLKHPNRSAQSVEVACKMIVVINSVFLSSSSSSSSAASFVNPVTIEVLVENMKNQVICTCCSTVAEISKAIHSIVVLSDTSNTKMMMKAQKMFLSLTVFTTQAFTNAFRVIVKTQEKMSSASSLTASLQSSVSSASLFASVSSMSATASASFLLPPSSSGSDE